MNADAARHAFQSAASGFVELVGEIPPEAWRRPALGVWDVRALVGHTSRAFSTIEGYLGGASTLPPVDGPVGYYLRALASGADAEARAGRDAAIAARGREAGEALGDVPAAALAALAARTQALVARTPDDAPVASPAGPMTLADYLPTRTFELTVHSLDLARALGVGTPAVLAPAITACCELAGSLAGRRPDAAELLLLLTGREHLRSGLTVL